MNIFTVVYPDGVKHGLFRDRSEAVNEAIKLSRNKKDGIYTVKMLDLYTSGQALCYIQ